MDTTTADSAHYVEHIAFDEVIGWLSQFDLTQNPTVENKARLLLLDTLSCAIAGLGETEPKQVASRLAALDPGGLSLPGLPGNFSTVNWAYAVSVGACWHEACEGSARAHGRPGLHAVPVAAALGLSRKATFKDVLEGIVWGYEIGARAGESMRIRQGLHVDGTWGLLASLAAAGRLYALSDDQILTALAAGACQIPNSLYFPIRSGCTVRNIYSGAAAAQAILTANAVAAGITAPPAVFEVAAAELAGDTSLTHWAWSPPGSFMILEGYLKPFAAVRHVHYGAACAAQWWKEHGAEGTERIKSIVLETYPEALVYCGNRNPKSAIQAQFSLSHGTAYTLRHGDLNPSAYRAAVFDDPEQRRLEALIDVREDDQLTSRGASLTIGMDDHEEVYSVTSVPGDLNQPLSETDVRDKAHIYLELVLGASDADRIVDTIMTRPLEDTFLLW